MMLLQAAKQSSSAVTAHASAPAGPSDVLQTYKGLAVQGPGEEFKLWEYEAGPLDPNDVEIKVR